jgi:competence protein ComEC
VRVLLAGDLQETGQAAALASVPDLSADVLLVPHHGSSHQAPAFLAAVRARVALISVGADNDYGHPATRTVTAVAGTGAQVFRTDRSGGVAVTGTGQGWAVTTMGPR